MERRNFLRVALRVAAGTAAAPAYLLAAPMADDGGEEERYLEAFRQQLIRLCKEGYEIKWCPHSPIRDGRRFVEVFHSRGVVEFWMDWR